MEVFFNDSEIDNIANYGSEITTKQIVEQLQQETEIAMQDKTLLIRQIRSLTTFTIAQIELYEKYYTDIKKMDIQAQKKALQAKIQMIYDNFLQLQNMINLFLGQKILITYVQVDEITGRRQIRLYNNDISHIEATIQSGWKGDYAKLTYEFDDHFTLLKNSMPDQENEGLQITANEVTARYNTYKKRVMWKINNEWYGYKLSNMGPINEAYAAFFIHEVKLDMGNLEQSIHQFMLDNKYGAIAADNANGFLIGDTSLNGVQFAVKGLYGGPQGYKTVLSYLKKLRDEDFSESGFQRFIQALKQDEQDKATSLIKPMTAQSLSGMIRYHGEKILEPLTNKF